MGSQIILCVFHMMLVVRKLENMIFDSHSAILKGVFKLKNSFLYVHIAKVGTSTIAN